MGLDGLTAGKEVTTPMDFQTEIVRSIQLMFDQKIGRYKADKTYPSVVKGISRKGYVILDSAGSERTVKCCIPNVSLRVGQRVFVKEPMGDLRLIHICGVMEK